MQFLVGPTTSAPAIAVGTEAEGDNMFVLSPSGSAVEVTAPKNVFRVCFSDPAQGTKSAEYIGSHNLGKKIGIIYDSSDVYSSGFMIPLLPKLLSRAWKLLRMSSLLLIPTRTSLHSYRR